ncbi:protein mono-ADP-ribosyltransferase PARP9 [Cololabis saira]|uniref:protein mono-ADP-ribosyltransferase PARP9 n=1 Tax=Cololabis saira TaxID=129043 RepID=UPI002AD4FB1D|nr:protein mono-ADP-ribosyltransferase PARP9 [Cololabis saira]
MASSLHIPLHGPSVNIVKKCQADLSDILLTKFGCVTTFDGVDCESEARSAQQQLPTVFAEKRFIVQLRGGPQVSVWKADLTSFTADALVNAANTSLQHSGGLAQALSAVGGPQIQRESSDYIMKYGDLKTGDTVVLGAGSLTQCKKIIHAVGPQLFKNPSRYDVIQAQPLLEKVIKNILDEVANHRLSTVAIPAISSGLFNYPLPLCAETIVAAVKNYYECSSHQRNIPKEIFLVNKDEPTVKQIERACQKIFPHGTAMLHSQAPGGNLRSGDKTSAQTIQIGKVLLTLMKDKIEEQQTDVIVNTASQDLNLTGGQISAAILKKAGHGMQKEIERVQKKGKIIITGGYNLNCKKVYHTFCIRNAEAGASKVLLQSVKECLHTAGANQYTSIAFPAIGTGNLGFSNREAAKIMLQAVEEFARNFPMTLNVFFVIYPFDDSAFQDFEDQIRNLKQEKSRSSVEPAFDGRSEVHNKGPLEPRISLSALSPESAEEAEKWLQDLLYNSQPFVNICNNFILHFGKKEFQRLSRLTKSGVSIEEFLTQGHACLKVEGHSREEIVIAALQVEKMLCDIQKEFVSEEERELGLLSNKNTSFERMNVGLKDNPRSDWSSAFRSQNLGVLKVEKVENPALTSLFELKKKQLNCSHPPETMFQRVPAQFCEMINRIGFYAECAPPDDPLFGEGIYFARTIKKAMELWRQKNEKHVYFVQADVLTGKATQGRPELILPPPVGTDPDVMFDSVSGGTDISVIFSGYQALPRYIITCARVGSDGFSVHAGI